MGPGVGVNPCAQCIHQPLHLLLTEPLVVKVHDVRVERSGSIAHRARAELKLAADELAVVETMLEYGVDSVGVLQLTGDDKKPIICSACGKVPYVCAILWSMSCVVCSGGRVNSGFP
jgi:hypothetical protein